MWKKKFVLERFFSNNILCEVLHQTISCEVFRNKSSKKKFIKFFKTYNCEVTFIKEICHFENFEVERKYFESGGSENLRLYD